MTIENILAEARESIEKLGYVDFPCRMKIWKTCGELCYPFDAERYKASPNAGWDERHNWCLGMETKIVTEPLKKRARLAELCVEKMLTMLYRDANLRSHYNYLKHIIKMVNSYLYGNTPKEALKKELNMGELVGLGRYEKMAGIEKAEPREDNINYEDWDDFYEWFERGVAHFVDIALHDEGWLYEELERKADSDPSISANGELLLKDADGEEPDCTETIAAMMYVSILRPNSYHIDIDPERQKEFWQWYINEAVPSVLCANTIEEVAKQEKTK